MNLSSKGGIADSKHPDKVVLLAFPLGGCTLCCLCHFAVSTDTKEDSRRRTEMCISVN